MKTKEEIEQLAKQLCNIPIDLVIDEEERYYKNLDKYDGIIQGYNQCLKDMAEKIEVSDRTVYRHIKRLTNAGKILVENGLYSANQSTF